jgi:hypothetical protein
MSRPTQVAVLVLIVLCGWVGPSSFAQDQGFAREIQARARIFPEIGPGIETLKRDAAGRYYILAAPAASVGIYGVDGRRIGQIPNAQSEGAKIAFASDMDIDPSGRVFIADRGASAVKIFGTDGALIATVHLQTPMSIAALSGLEFAATLLHSDHLVSVLNLQGSLIRSFGESSGQPAGPALLGRGRVYGDARDQIYFVFTDLPDPTIRRYDRYGYASWDVRLPASEFKPRPGAKQWTKVTIGSDEAPPPRPVIRALAVDPETEEVWAAIGDTLVDLDKDGTRLATYLTATKEGARIEAVALLVEHDRILVADDPNGIFEFALPQARETPPKAH